jgi:hypothetical protein
MDIRVTVDSSEVVALVSNVIRQLPYAANNAITRTAKEAVDGAKAELRRDVVLRKTFLLGRIKILQYSKVGNLTAIIGVDANVQGAPLILGFLEEGGEKTGSSGSGVAIPLTGEKPRPSFPMKVKPAYRYTSLNFVGNKGKLGTYVVPNVGVFQRVSNGRAPEDTKLIYLFKPSVPLTIHTHLREAMLEVIGRRFASIFTEEFSKEILKRAEHIS